MAFEHAAGAAVNPGSFIKAVLKNPVIRHSYPSRQRAFRPSTRLLALPNYIYPHVACCLDHLHRALPAVTYRSPAVRANWIHEIKHDGYRLMAQRDPVGIRL